MAFVLYLRPLGRLPGSNRAPLAVTAARLSPEEFAWLGFFGRSGSKVSDNQCSSTNVCDNE